MRPALRLGAAVFVASVLLVGCRTKAEVGIDIAEDGSGTVSVSVELDAEAADAIGGSEGLVLTDLTDTAWRVTGPDPSESGGLVVLAEHDFAGGQDLASVLDTVAGPEVFDDVSIDIEQSFGSSEWSAGMSVAVTGDPTQFSDDALAEVLGGLPLGRTPEELAQVGATTPGAATMLVELSLFGQDSDAAELDLTGGEPSSAELSVNHSETQASAYVLAALAAAMLVAAIVFVGLAIRARRRS